MGGKRIDCYMDVASFYSYVAFADLLPNIEKLAAHGVEVEIHPVLLGGINGLTGNKPPWTLPARAKYLSRDSQRAARRVGLDNIRAPKDLLGFGHTLSPLRALLYIKAAHPRATFLSAMGFFFHRFFTPPNVNLTVDANLRACLLEATEAAGDGSSSSRLLFSEEEVDRIMDKRVEMKDALKETTARAVELGAFGAPWFWVTDGEGKGEAFFGSDRFNHIFEYLGVPFQDVKMLPASKL